MPKKLYLCEVCGKRQNKTQVVCCICVERDLLRLNERINFLEKQIRKQKGEIK